MDNSARRIDRVRLGAVAAVDTTTNGTLYFDAFESRRSTYIGPMPSPVVTTTINYVYDPLYRLKEANYSDGRYFHYILRLRSGQALRCGGQPVERDEVPDVTPIPRKRRRH